MDDEEAVEDDETETEDDSDPEEESNGSVELTPRLSVQPTGWWGLQ